MIQPLTTPQLSEVRKSSLEMVNGIFQIGMKYVKHQTLASFFVRIFKPRIDRIISLEAPEKELIDVMWSVKNQIDPVLEKIEQAQSVIKGRELNEPKIQAQVEKLLLKNNSFVKHDLIDENKAAEILGRLIR